MGGRTSCVFVRGPTPFNSTVEWDNKVYQGADTGFQKGGGPGNCTEVLKHGAFAYMHATVFPLFKKSPVLGITPPPPPKKKKKKKKKIHPWSLATNLGLSYCAIEANCYQSLARSLQRT